MQRALPSLVPQAYPSTRSQGLRCRNPHLRLLSNSTNASSRCDPSAEPRTSEQLDQGSNTTCTPTPQIGATLARSFDDISTEKTITTSKHLFLNLKWITERPNGQSNTPQGSFAERMANRQMKINACATGGYEQNFHENLSARKVDELGKTNMTQQDIQETEAGDQIERSNNGRKAVDETQTADARESRRLSPQKAAGSRRDQYDERIRARLAGAEAALARQRRAISAKMRQNVKSQQINDSDAGNLKGKGRGGNLETRASAVRRQQNPTKDGGQRGFNVNDDTAAHRVLVEQRERASRVRRKRTLSQESAGRGANDRATRRQTKDAGFTRQERELEDREESNVIVDYSRFLDHMSTFSRTDLSELFETKPQALDVASQVNESSQSVGIGHSSEVPAAGVILSSTKKSSNGMNAPDGVASTVYPTEGFTSKQHLGIADTQVVGRSSSIHALHHIGGDYSQYLPSKVIERGGYLRNISALDLARFTLAQRSDVNNRSKAAALGIIALSVKQKDKPEGAQ